MHDSPLSPLPTVDTGGAWRLPAGIAPVPHLGVIRASGADAAAFIHGQLSNDFVQLDSQHARLAAFCSPKGRMQASFIGLRPWPQDVLLLCSRDLVAQTVKRLSMFVLRARCSITDASADYQIWGLCGEAAPEARPWTVQPVDAGADAGWRVTLPPACGSARALLLLPASAPAPTAPAGWPVLDAAVWQWGEVMSAVATISLPVFDYFVPQMLNYESVGGVNFAKGCYPGQEVIARSQFRGTLKRRAFVVQSGVALAAGQDVFTVAQLTSEGADAQPVGTVAQAAMCPPGVCHTGDAAALWHAIVSITTSAAEAASAPGGANGAHASAALCTQDGAALTLLPLPYRLRDDI